MRCSLILPAIVLVCCSTAQLVTSQQSYSPSVCRNSTSALGYACNGLKKRCRTYLIFRAQPPYNNASSIASLLGSDPAKIARLNNISETAVLVTRKEVIVPINCSCAASYYQSNTSYVVRANDTPYLIANATFEGATTCKAIQHQRSGLVEDIFPGETLTVPLRCACPTRNQSRRAGIKYLMTYVIKSGDTISTISLRFGAPDVGETLVANQKSVQDSIIQPFTTLLVPLRNPPNSSMTVTPHPPTSTTTTTPTSPPPLGSNPAPGSTKKWNYFLYGLIAGGGFVLLFGAISFSLLAQRRKARKGKVMSSSSSPSQGKPIVKKSYDAEIDISNLARSLKVYSYEELQSATDDFSPTSLISGCVYRGIILQDGLRRQVAIKKTQGDVSREMDILNKINHFNIIALLGVCYDNGVWYMVYEYAPNGRLSDLIYQSSEDGMPLSWERRVQIALDVATGLHYLHGYTSPPLIHKDLKCSHVLLDEELRAKISHFGLSKSVGEEEEEAGQFALTNHIVGTKGYMAPEYVQNGLVTTKMDVYAFGILIVEILTGKEVGLLCVGDCVPLSEILDPLLAEQSDCENKLRDFMDPGLQHNYPTDVVTAFVRLADECVSKDPRGRPAMDDVVRVLSKALTCSLVWASSTSSISSHATITRMSAE